MQQMAVPLHYTAPPSSLSKSRLPLPNFSLEFLVCGKANFPLFNEKKLSFPFGVSSRNSRRSRAPSEIGDKLVSSQHVHSVGSNHIPVIKWEKNEETEENLFAHQDSGTMREPFRFGTSLFVVGNTLMLAAPFEALADTCEADNSLFNMPLLLVVALIGATVGGLLARERKGELKRLNDQLRQINAALRRQAKIESYAPALSYAPSIGRIPENEVIVDSRKHELISHLKTGKNFLRNEYPEKAYQEFQVALELAQTLKDPIEEKKAARGLGASLQRQKKYREAIKYHSMVLSISEREGEDSGRTEAYGAIADCYTELGDLERAGKFYDEYIARLEKD